MKKIEVRFYTAHCICTLFHTVKNEKLNSQRIIDEELDAITLKQEKAYFDLLDKIILKIEKALLTKSEGEQIKIKLEYYQAFAFSQFLFDYQYKFKGIAEHTALNLLATKIDQNLLWK